MFLHLDLLVLDLSDLRPFVPLDVVLGKSCSQAKHTAMHVLPGQKMPTASFASAKDATTSFA